MSKTEINREVAKCIDAMCITLFPSKFNFSSQKSSKILTLRTLFGNP